MVNLVYDSQLYESPVRGLRSHSPLLDYVISNLFVVNSFFCESSIVYMDLSLDFLADAKISRLLICGQPLKDSFHALYLYTLVICYYGSICATYLDFQRSSLLSYLVPKLHLESNHGAYPILLVFLEFYHDAH
jgi:hypothetical protein